MPTLNPARMTRQACLAGLLTLSCAAALAQATSGPGEPAIKGKGASASGYDQVVYKGLVGNALEAVPMDAEKRVALQRTNAVVSNTMSARSLTILAKLTNPVLLIGGFAWGLWSAANINAPDTAPAANVAPENATASESSDAPLAEPAPPIYEPLPHQQGANGALAATTLPTAGIPRTKVIKIWLAHPGG